MLARRSQAFQIRFWSYPSDFRDGMVVLTVSLWFSRRWHRVDGMFAEAKVDGAAAVSFVRESDKHAMDVEKVIKVRQGMHNEEQSIGTREKQIGIEQCNANSPSTNPVINENEQTPGHHDIRLAR